MTTKEALDLYRIAYKKASDTEPAAMTGVPCPGRGLRNSGLTDEEINSLSDEEYNDLLEKWRKSREEWRAGRTQVRASRQAGRN